MASPEQLVQMIRFGLETLRERNGHHEFEALCLGVARRRIASNLLPATGPVSSGGDQGRDAESHWTALPSEISAESAFVKLATTDDVVLACTMQTTGVPTKIANDITSIIETGLPVSRIVYFTVTPVEVSKRHKLQQDAKTKHGIALDIWDALALAQSLAESDLFYLAVQYLHTPSELAPPQPESDSGLPTWYVEDRTRWRARTQPAQSFGELIDLREPLRYATFHASARADLADWLSYARALLAATRDRDVATHCRYEIAVATLRGTNTLRPADDLVRAFFEDVLRNDADNGLLEDALVLGQYCTGAYGRSLTDLTADEVLGWRDELHSKIRRLLAAGPYPNAKAQLLALSARLSLQTVASAGPSAENEPSLSPSEVTERVKAMLDAGETIQPDLSGLEIPDLDAAMADLELLCQALPSAPMFPIDTIADYFDMLAPLLADHPSYPAVRDELDSASERVHGEAAKADRSRDRSMGFLRSGKLLAALNEIHNAKINWWHGDTVEGAVLALLLASHIYSQLNLPLAAKQHALVAAGLAKTANQPDLLPRMARAWVMAVIYDYEAGNWLSASALAKVAISAQGDYVDDPWNLELHSEFCTMISYQAMILRTARSLRPELAPLVEADQEATGANAIVDGILEGVAQYPVRSEDECAQMADEEGMGRPLSDAGRVRTYTWTALGTSWTVTAANERKAVLAAERFAAATQIILAELAGDEALILRGQIHIEVRPDARPGSGIPPCQPVRDNHASRWILHLAPVDEIDINTFHKELTAALVYVLVTNSLLSQQQFMQIIHTAFERGLWHKLAMGRPYDEVADLLPDTAYAAMAAARGTRIGKAPGRPASAGELLPSTRPGPGYDRDAFLERVRSRYENCMLITRYTLPRIVNDQAFRATISKLRDEGWLDWHLLVSIANHVGNKRLRWEGVHMPPRNEAERIRAGRTLTRAERPTDIRVHADEFTEAAMRFSLQTAVLDTLRVLGLQCHQATPDFDAIFELLGARYEYWSDDVEHPDVFHWSST